MSVTPAKARRAAIYTRVSTVGQQREGTSLESQYLACKRKADDIGATVIAAFEEQASGGDLVTRTGIQDALKLIESGEADTLIIYDMSRYSRDAIHQQQILNRVLQAGGQLVFTTFDLGDLRDNPEGRLAFGVQGVFAEYERMKIRSRMMQGRRASAEKGLQVTPHAPYGYEIATRDKIMQGRYKLEDHKKYFIVEEQAERVRDIFHRYASGQSLYAIARAYNEAGYPTPKGRGVWRPTSIRVMLRNPTYKGTAHFGKYSSRRDEARLESGLKSAVYLADVPEAQRVAIEVPAIVDETTWEACQHHLKTNQSRLGQRPHARYMLTSLLRCDVCGRKMHGNKQRKKGRINEYEPVYQCQSVSSFHSEKLRCKASFYRGEKLEQIVLKTIAAQLADPSLLAAALAREEAAKKKPSTGTFDKAALHRKLRELEKRERATVQAQINALQNNISSRVYESELSRITTEKTEIERTLDELQKTALAPKRIKTQSQRMAVLLADKMSTLIDPAVSPTDKREILFGFLDSITPRRTGHARYDVELKWRETGEK